ncbi:MAG: hypothetical protein KJ971_04625 [Firmicutes bacterium]|nr:hypothetical protein [Bacillota bacterium]
MKRVFKVLQKIYHFLLVEILGKIDFTLFLKVLKRIDLILLFFISIIAITVFVVDTFDLYPLSSLIGVVEINYSLICLLVLSFIGFHLVARYLTEEDHKQKSLNKIDELLLCEGNLLNKVEGNLLNKIDELITSSNLIKVRTFEDSFELETYVAKRIHEAKKEICDLTWKLTIESGYGLGKRKDSQSIYDKAIAGVSAKLIFNEIWVFSDSRRIARFNKRIKEKKDGYSCRYFKEESNKIPRLQFIIIDDSEVIFFAISKTSLMCSIKGEVICRIFKPYFIEAWQRAIPIKDGRNIRQNIVNEINEYYKLKVE